MKKDMNCESNVWTYELLDWIDPEEINWSLLSLNPNAIHLLEKNPEEINWSFLSRNPNAISLLEKNPEKISWYWLSENPNAIHLLEKNPEKINDILFYTNPSIFKKKINYKYLYQRMNIIREELLMRCMHPSRLERWLEMGGDIDDF